MKALGLNDIRKRFLDFFASKNHLCKESYSLVPENDPSILLINAGMTPLKPYFTGAEEPPRRRMATCQKCIRTPDIERVGYTARHGTYFEMLGNFSFGDYFKREAIFFAWEFFTKELEIPKELIHVSVYEEDQEAYDIWLNEVGIEESHLVRLGKEDNFWEHGTGPCGPCSEIYFDRGEAYGPEDYVGGEGDRFIEVWNLVFSQFDRQEDGSYLTLKQKNIDTGAGLERLACVMQGVDNLFEVDTVRAILDKACALTGKTYGQDAMTDVALRVITDHIRSTTMMIADGVLPSNEGRGYVLRRLLRRAARFGRLLGLKNIFLKELVPVVIQENQDAYPSLLERKNHILRVVEQEEKRFLATVEQGTALLDEYLEECKKSNKKILAGEDAFKLHDTYGFPLDLTKEIAREQGIEVDEKGFQKAMHEQKERARAALKQKGKGAWGNHSFPKELEQYNPTQFLGYEQLSLTDAVLLAMLGEEEGKEEIQLLDQVGVDQEIDLLFEKTPFYATSGGQEGDTGSFETATGKAIILSTWKNEKGLFFHKARVLNGYLEVGQKGNLQVQEEKRKATERNHSVTHLLHLALRKFLGDHVSQAGSFQNFEKTRFDFHHNEAIKTDTLQEIEEFVQKEIWKDHLVETQILSLEEAKKTGAMALFGEKYGDKVRVVRIGDSLELCGGTHVKRSSEIGSFRILNETSVASGIRRVEAVTGEAAYRLAKQEQKYLKELSELLKCKEDNLLEKVESLQKETKYLQREKEKFEAQQVLQVAEKLKTEIEVKQEIALLIATAQLAQPDHLKLLADELKNSLGEYFLLLANPSEDKVQFLAAASSKAIARDLQAGQMVKLASSICGGGGGGRPDMAQAGGKEISKLPEALQQVRELCRAKLEEK